MAPHSSTLAWKHPWMEKPGRLQSMGSLRVRHNWAEVPASPRGEALFRCARPSGGPSGPATSTGSLASQRHPGKFPKVPGRRRGKRGFPAAPRQRPRESFFNAFRGTFLSKSGNLTTLSAFPTQSTATVATICKQRTQIHCSTHKDTLRRSNDTNHVMLKIPTNLAKSNTQ